jgi:hypothetical protein
MVRSLGADHVIDYTKEDFSQTRQQYDLILAVNGYHPISDYLRALKPEGTYVVAGSSMAQLIEVASNRKRGSKAGSQKICVLTLKPNQKDFVFIKELIELGKIMPVIDDFYLLSKTAGAFWYFEKEHPKGKVVIRVKQNHKTIQRAAPDRYSAMLHSSRRAWSLDCSIHLRYVLHTVAHFKVSNISLRKIISIKKPVLFQTQEDTGFCSNVLPTVEWGPTLSAERKVL